MWSTVYPKKYAHGFVVLCFVVVMQSFIMNSHEVFIHIHQGCFAGTGAIVRLPQCQWSKPDGYGKISQYIITTKHSKANTVCVFLGIYCRRQRVQELWLPKAFVSSDGIWNLPITSLPVDNFNVRALWCKPTGINYNMHGWIFCRYCATGWFGWISGLRAVAMWSSSSFTKMIVLERVYRYTP